MTKRKKPKTTTPWEESQERQERIEAKVEALLVEGYRCFSQAQIQAERMVDCKKWCKNRELLEIKQNCEDECCNPCEEERHMYQAQRLELERGRLIKHDKEDERRRILESPIEVPKPKKCQSSDPLVRSSPNPSRVPGTPPSAEAPPKARPPKAPKPSPDKELEKEAPKDTPSESRAPQTPPSDPEPPKPKARPPRAQKPTPEQLELCLVPKAGPPKKSPSPEPKKDVRKSKAECPSPEPEKSNAEEKEKSKVKEGRSMSSRSPKSNNAKENREGRARGSKDKEGRSRFSRSRSSKKVKESLEGRSKESNKRRHRSPTPPWQQRKSSGHSFLNRKVKCFRGCDIRIGCTCA